MKECRRGRVFCVETTKAMSEADIEELCALFEILKDRYHFRWSQTYNPKWVRALADEMEAEQRCQNG